MTSPGLTLDTGVLIALERRHQGAWHVMHTAVTREVTVTVPTPVLAEWWRSRSDMCERIRAAVVREPLSEAIAARAGEALARVKGATVIDAIVMASAASRGDIVYTSDDDDLSRLNAFFPTVRVLSI